jgi:hypothetical protein
MPTIRDNEYLAAFAVYAARAQVAAGKARGCAIILAAIPSPTAAETLKVAERAHTAALLCRDRFEKLVAQDGQRISSLVTDGIGKACEEAEDLAFECYLELARVAPMLAARFTQ